MADGEVKVVKIDFTSSLGEKVVDAAKEFLGKLVGPPLEEAGLLLKDQVTYLKFRNQVNILNKAKAYCEKKNISPKSIPLKLMCPLLDHAAIEDDEILQEKWAILLGNLVDSNQNIQNHVFPALLSQISLTEYKLIESCVLNHLAFMNKTRNDIIEYDKLNNEKARSLKDQIHTLKPLIDPSNLVPWDRTQEYTKLYNQYWQLKWDLEGIDAGRYNIEEMLSFKPIPDFKDLKEFEIANLTRLAILKEVTSVSNLQQKIELHRWGEPLKEIVVNPVTQVKNSFEVTELGVMFISACNEKHN